MLWSAALLAAAACPEVPLGEYVSGPYNATYLHSDGRVETKPREAGALRILITERTSECTFRGEKAWGSVGGHQGGEAIAGVVHEPLGPAEQNVVKMTFVDIFDVCFVGFVICN